MRLRLEPRDEYLHELGPEPNFNESMYFNVYDPGARVGAFFRVGNRANEGRAEMTVCVYLPDGRVAFMYQRPDIADNSAFDAAGLRFDVVEPFESLTVRYDGQLLVLDEPREMADPRRAFRENPYSPASIHLEYGRVSDMFGGEPEGEHERPGEEFARGHYEQLVRASGSLTIGHETLTVEGFGLRDHSWGPRSWQAPWYYRWLTANFGDSFGFMGSRIAREDRDGVRTGFVWDDGRLHVCDDLRISTEFDDESHQRSLHATLRSSAEDRTWEIAGRVLNLIPLRNRRDGRVTRIAEGLTEWTVEGRGTGYGWSEYLDQIVDGRPVGLAE